MDAGPDNCAFYESSVDKVEERYKFLLATLKVRPIAVHTTDTASTALDYGIVDYSVALSNVFGFLYQPYRSGRAATLAAALAAAEKGNGQPLWDLQKANIEQFTCKCPYGSEDRASAFSRDASAAIACSDGEPLSATPKDLQEWYDWVGQDSEFVALWLSFAICTSVLQLRSSLIYTQTFTYSGWKIRSVERFAGMLPVTPGRGSRYSYNIPGPFVGNTSYPLLIIGNTADPVTPLRKYVHRASPANATADPPSHSAHMVSKGFNASVVLTQNSAGVSPDHFWV